MRPKLLFFPFALIIFIWSFVSFTKPAWTDYQTGKETLKKNITEKQSLAKGVENIKKALVIFNQLDEDDKKIVYNAVPELSDEDNLIAEINKNASQSGVMIMKVTSKKSRQNMSSCNSGAGSKNKKDCIQPAIPITVNISAIASYPMVKDFLKRLDVQNRIIVPRNFSLALASNNASSNNSDKKDNIISFVNVKITFDVFYKKNNTKIVLSKSINGDETMKSLLRNGLDKDGLRVVNDIITSELFYPVSSSGTGKDNLFEQTVEPIKAIQ